MNLSYHQQKEEQLNAININKSSSKKGSKVKISSPYHVALRESPPVANKRVHLKLISLKSIYLKKSFFNVRHRLAADSVYSSSHHHLANSSNKCLFFLFNVYLWLILAFSLKKIAALVTIAMWTNVLVFGLLVLLLLRCTNTQTSYVDYSQTRQCRKQRRPGSGNSKKYTNTFALALLMLIQCIEIRNLMHIFSN